MKGTASVMPDLAHEGHHDLELVNWITDWNDPSASPAATATPIDCNRATSAAASAGTTASV